MSAQLFDVRFRVRTDDPFRFLCHYDSFVAFDAGSANYNNRGSNTSHVASFVQDMLDEIDNQLKDLNVPLGERRALGAHYVRLIGFDLYMVYARTLERYFQTKEAMLLSELNKSQSADAKAELERWRSRDWHPNYSLFDSLATYSFEDEINRTTSGAWMNAAEKASFDAYKNEMVSLYRTIQAKGGYTPEAAEYYEKYNGLGGQDKKIIEKFGINPSEPR